METRSMMNCGVSHNKTIFSKLVKNGKSQEWSQEYLE